MTLREITHEETDRLLDCLKDLAEYHNRVSTHFRGIFPLRAYRETLRLFSEALQRGESRIAVIEEEGEIIGFCKIDCDAGSGTGQLDYLVVLEEHRGKGHGRRLMDWAMRVFQESGITRIEVKVVDGNPAVHLYERYGFRIKSHIMLYRSPE